jgi:tryptophanase
MKNIISIALLSAVFLTAPALAQLTPAAGLNFKLGDDVSTVKTALHTNIDPEPIESALPAGFNMNAGKSILHMRTKGITINFNKKEIAELIKIDEAYSGSVAGVKLGDSEKTLRSVMGKPVKTPTPLGANQIFLYALDDTAYIRFDVNENNGVQAIYIQK